MTIFLLVISYIIGLYFFRNNWPIIIVISVLFIAFLIFKVGLKRLPIFLFAFSLGISTSAVIHFTKPTSKEYFGMVVESSENYFIFQSGIYRFYVYEKENDRQFGDFIYIIDEPEEINFVSYESRFDFNYYLKDKGVEYSLSIYKSETKFSSPIRIKKAKDKFLNSFDEETKALISAFLFARADTSNETIGIANEVGLLFLFSVSGIYLSFILNGLKRIFRLILHEKLADIIPLIVLAPFFIFVFPKVGVIRVFSVYIFKYINENFLNKRFSHLKIISFVALTMLVINPTYAYQAGYYIGFSLSAFIYFLGESLSRFKKIKSKIMMRVFVYLFLIPVASISHYSFHVFSLLFQVISIPINEIFFITSLVSLYITPFTHVLKFMGDILKNYYSFLGNIDIVLPLGYFGDFYILIYYILYIYSLYLFESRRRLHLIKASSVLSIFMLVSFLPLRTYLVNGIYFINVGQGDSILIQNRGHAVMIDTGGNLSFDMAKETLIPFLYKRQIYRIDALITTHSDFDHSGAASSLIKYFPVKTYLTQKEEFPYKVGDIYLENLNNYSANDPNDSSLVFNLEFMNKKWLLMGDASISVERQMLKDYPDLDCDIIKLGHHGSKTSSCDEFIKKVSPDIAIISCGANNKYGHPSKEVIDTLNKYKIEVRRTDYEGTISFVNYFT